MTSIVDGTLLGRPLLTGFIAPEHPTAWRRFRLLSGNGLPSGLRGKGRDDLQRVRLRGEDMDGLDGFQRWGEDDIPVELGLVVWHLRVRQQQDGGLVRFHGAPNSSLGTATRYAELSGSLFADPLRDDPNLPPCLAYLSKQIGVDGGVRTPGLDEPDVGMTARMLRAFALCGLLSSPDPHLLAEFLVSRASHKKGIAMWSTFEGGRPATGATALASEALWLADAKSHATLLRAGRAWLEGAQRPDGGWGEHTDGGKSQPDNTYWVLRSLSRLGIAESVFDPARAYLKAVDLAELPPAKAVYAYRGRVLLESIRTTGPLITIPNALIELALRRDVDGYVLLGPIGSLLAEHRGLALSGACAPASLRIPSGQPDFLSLQPDLYEVISARLAKRTALRVIDAAYRWQLFELLVGGGAGTLAALTSLSGSRDAILGAGLVGKFLSVSVLVFAVAWLVLRRWFSRGWIGRASLVASTVLAGGIATAYMSVWSGPQSVLPRVATAVSIFLTIDIVGVITDRLTLLNRFASSGRATAGRLR